MGSVTRLTDASQGTAISYGYSPWGDTTPSATFENPFQYTGREMASEFYHYRARAYDPEIGRFLQKDPAGMADGTNMYAYVGNNPVNSVDPSGLAMKGKVGGGGGGVYFAAETATPGQLDCGAWYEWLFNPFGTCAGVLVQLYWMGGAAWDEAIFLLIAAGAIMSVWLGSCVAGNYQGCVRFVVSYFTLCSGLYAICEKYDWDPPPEEPRRIGPTQPVR